ncbi:MAG: protein-L-isoaspartate(D-aspartate) O-methyltransferase [bacterium]
MNLQTDFSLRPGDTPEYFEARRAMIKKQVVARGVTNNLVLQAMENVPRHRFVNERLESVAYDDSPVPIEENQTVSQPFIVAYMTAALDLQGDEKILEVGCGSGYQTAVLAEIVDHVYSVEINENLTIEAARRLKKLGYANITLKCDDGCKGWEEFAPYDGIVVTAAPHEIPPLLVKQLKKDGKMVIPVGDADQELIVVFKDVNGYIRKESRMPVRFVPLLTEKQKRD